MFKSVAKSITILFLIAGLAACDNNTRQKKPATPPAPVSIPATSATSPLLGVFQQGDKIQLSLIKGQATLMLPVAFNNQTQRTGGDNDGDTQTLRLINPADKQTVIITTGRPMASGQLDTSDDTFDILTRSSLIGFSLSHDYQDLKKLSQQNLTIDSHKFRRFDTTQQIEGEQTLAVTIFTALDGQIVLLHIVSPANNAAGHNALVTSTIDSIKIN